MCSPALARLQEGQNAGQRQTEPQEATGIQCRVQGRVSRRDSGSLERLTHTTVDVLFSYMPLPVIIFNSKFLMLFQNYKAHNCSHSP